MDLYDHIPALNANEIRSQICFCRFRNPLMQEFVRVFPGNALKRFSTMSRPVMLVCETVNICTNACIICPYRIMQRKKEVMPLDLFKKVLGDYAAMGGGYLSLTPKQGEVFLDNLLYERIQLIQQFPEICGISITTNAVAADRFQNSELRTIVRAMTRINFSIYGLNNDEYSLMTGTDHYQRMCKNIRNICALVDAPDVVRFSFRLLKHHTEDEISAWIRDHAGRDAPYGYTYTYMDWNGHIPDNSLPYEGVWRPKRENTTQCLLPLVTCLVFSSGDVSFCPCNNYDGEPEFCLGSVKDQTLTSMYNSEKCERLWKNIPQACMNCSSHRPVNLIDRNHRLFKNPLDIIGG